MDNETEIVREYVQSLPQAMRDYLNKNTWPQKLSLIVQTNNLDEEQAIALKGEVFLIIIGIENYSDLRKNIRENVIEIDPGKIDGIASSIEKNIFFEIKPLLDEMEKTNEEAEKNDGSENENNLNKDKVLNEIENPVPTKPRISNPAGVNIVLDAQHNLPEQEHKILISSTSVPSRGPILNNFKTNFTPTPTAPTAPKNTPSIPPIQQAPKPTVSPIRPQPIPPKLVTPQTSPKPISQPVQPQPVAPKPITPSTSPQPTQPQKLPQTPIPPAPKKYTVDPYREPIE
jgi:hypothetical protein